MQTDKNAIEIQMDRMREIETDANTNTKREIYGNFRLSAKNAATRMWRCAWKTDIGF